MRKLLIAGVLLLSSVGFAPASAQAAPAPITTTNLKTSGPATTCVRGAGRPLINATSPVLQAFVPAVDPNVPGSAKVEFRIIDLADSSVAFADESFTKVRGSWFAPQGIPTLLDGKTYSWQARWFDGTEYSAWSATCEFSLDTVKPNAPGVTITPDGPYKVGQKITVHFTNGGSSDVVRYSYHLMGGAPFDVAPCPGTATIKLTRIGPDYVSAASFDKAGNKSLSEVTVDFTVVS